MAGAARLGLTYNDKGRGLGLVWQALKYATTNKGLLGLPASPIRAYVRTRPGLDAPNAAIAWLPFLADGNYKLAKRSGLTATVNTAAVGEHRQHPRRRELGPDASGGALQFPQRRSWTVT